MSLFDVTKAGVLVFDAGTKQIQVTKAGILVFDTLRPPPPPPADCTVELTVYEDDGETIAWQVSTDPAHETPYLVEPTNYGSQEVDFGEGRASIGQVTVTVIDPAQIPGDQDGGWLTERLADDLGLGAIQGRRCLLRRWAGIGVGWVVIADGPAGVPRMDASFAAYVFDVRDNRERERRLRAFETTDTCTVLPMGVANGWGTLPERVLTGTFKIESPIIPFGPTPTMYFDFVPHEWIGNVVNDRAVVSQPAEAAFAPVPSPGGFGRTYPSIQVRWRTSFGAEWHVVPPINLVATVPALTVVDAKNSAGEDVRGVRRLTVGHPPLVGLPPGLPNHNDVVQVQVRYIGETTENFPLHIETTAGQFLQDLYDGVYSPRDQNGDIAPTGIRYDADALAVLDTPVFARITEPAEDLREWAERNIYAPLGLAPALDNDGRISPVPAAPPPNLADVAVDLTDVLTEPEPSWAEGDRIINLLTFKYPRYYGGGSPAMDGFHVHNVVLTDKNDASIARFGVQEHTIETVAFGAIGTAGTASPIGEEVGADLAVARAADLFARYRYPVPVVTLTVRRSATVALRVGDWVRLSQSWLPSYVTRRRGLANEYGQIIEINDLDCAWRRLTVELVRFESRTAKAAPIRWSARLVALGEETS